MVVDEIVVDLILVDRIYYLVGFDYVYSFFVLCSDEYRFVFVFVADYMTLE